MATAADPTPDEILFVRVVQCADNLHQIGSAIYVYADAHHGSFPPDLGTLMVDLKLPMDMFVCPGSGSALPAGWKTLPDAQRSAWVNAHTDYIYAGAKWGLGSVQLEAPMVYEKADDHGGSAMNVLFGSGENRILSIDEIKKLGGNVGPKYATTRVKAAPGQPPVKPLISIDQAKGMIAKFDMSTIDSALARFQLDTGRFPTKQEGLAILVKNSTPGVEGWKGPYAGGIPADPWGRPFVYTVGGQEPYTLSSAGPDGKPGTADDVRLH